MNPNVKKYTMFLAVAIILSIFSFSFMYAVVEEPEWSDFCDEGARPVAVPLEKTDRTGLNAEECPEVTYPTEVEEQACKEQNGIMQLKYGYDNCPQKYYCETCQYEYEQERSAYNLIIFLMACGFALLAIVIGITTPGMKGEFADIISPGFILGGLITLFIGTAMYFDDMSRVVRPIVMFVELIVVLYLIYWAVKKKK